MTSAPIVTILFTDVVGSTALFDRVGDDVAHALHRAHLAELSRLVAEHEGTVVKTLGDGLMAVFGSALAAVRCAVEMQVGVAADAAGLELRVGLDCGEPIQEDGDYFGNPVIVAKRLCDLAERGQIVATAVVAGVLGRRLDAVSTTSLGKVAVKGIAEGVDAMVVNWRDAGVAPEAPAAIHRTRVLIVDDQRLLRAGFSVILDSERDLEVVGEASDGLEAIDAVRRLSPDVVVMDVRMPNMDGLEAARQILSSTPETRVLMLTTFDIDEYVFEALKAGASGFLLKDAPGEQLIAAVRCIANGDAMIDPSITKRLIAQFAQAAQPARELPTALLELTQRETEILRLIAKGLSNAEIAKELFVEESTVKSHVGNVLQKLGLRDRVQAVVFAYESGFVTA